MGIDSTIVRAAIHPGIGVARIGNSPDEYYVGPELMHVPPMAPGSLRDAQGALKRQAARFRIYGYNAAGEVVRELTADQDQIEWEVELANTKAAWYQFQLALDVPEAAAADPTILRNATVKDRKSLAIRPGARRIAKGSDPVAFDSGSFCGKPVYLGELRIEKTGQLLVLGGRGVSASVDGSKATTFANNEGWHDDVADGPVRAKVVVAGVSVPVDAAWVTVAPPNYGPQMKSVRTMKDLMEDVFIRSGMAAFPLQVSFSRHILPILQRQSSLQWANKGFAAQFGWGAAASADDEAWIARLNSPGTTWAELRQQVANAFRRFDRDGASPQPWPWLYGDAMAVPPADTPRQHAALTATQLRMLDLWAAGHFLSDWTPGQKYPAQLSDVPLQEQPTMLDHAAMDDCLADAFHPGCEITWPMRHASMYRAPFRIREAAENPPELQLYGSRLTPAVALSESGPLYAQVAGDLTRWMAVPWQTDTASCRSGYYAGYGPRYDPYLPTFWPARVPNQVLTQEAYEKVIDTELPREQRVAAFNRRESWFRTLGEGGYESEINRMISHFGDMGVIENRPGPLGDKDFPPLMQVENRIAPAPSHMLKTAVQPAGQEAPPRIEPFDADNEEQLRALTQRGPVLPR
ncbi:LodA/GoxA family CTQ-dependent oxidase [Delftia tsuruhatensis]|uniref:LodA/GoxA family CTQ-dependent oxidase n=1 Tax=Delftia tsuruhatensis TaxID=180282 RepID=UPI0028AD61BF|nr:LodA/GoxA family CTQ-dependent oxidase [Delftia tsuruhatensis]